MIIAISLDREFDNYSEFFGVLTSLAAEKDFKEFCGVESSILTRFKQETRKPVQSFKINWGVSKDTPKDNIKMNKAGKPYDSAGPLNAAKKVVDYATHVVEFGKGDYTINKLGKDKLIRVSPDKKVVAINKKYNF